MTALGLPAFGTPDRVKGRLRMVVLYYRAELAALVKTQVRQLAAHLGVSGEIINRPPRAVVLRASACVPGSLATWHDGEAPGQSLIE